jgi:hypothetical protein
MNDKTNQLLVKAFTEAVESGAAGDRVQTYSGRGMYGKECISISGSKAECRRIISNMIGATLIYDLLDQADANFVADTQQFDMEREACAVNDAINVLLDWSEDSLGHGVVYYWPAIEPLDRAANEKRQRELG